MIMESHDSDMNWHQAINWWLLSLYRLELIVLCNSTEGRYGFFEMRELAICKHVIRYMHYVGKTIPYYGNRDESDRRLHVTCKRAAVHSNGDIPPHLMLIRYGRGELIKRCFQIIPVLSPGVLWRMTMWCLPTIGHKEWCARYYYRNDKESRTFQWWKH